MPIIQIWIEIILITMIMGMQFLATTSTFQIQTQDKVLTKNRLCFSNSDKEMVRM